MYRLGDVMEYNKGPSVINTYPRNYQTDIPTDIEILIEFDIDIAKNTIPGNVQVLNFKGEKIDCRLVYENRKIKAIPRTPLDGTNSYKVVVKGDNNPNTPSTPKGITNPLGAPLLGDYIFSFSTFSEKLEVEKMFNGTPNNIVLSEQPIFKAEITKETNNNVLSCHIQISDSNTFDDILWDGESDIETLSSGLKADYDFKEGTYYWRVRAKSAMYGTWSETFQFAMHTTSDNVVEEDETEFDVAFPDAWNMLEPNVTEVYPEDNFSNVSTNLKTISVVLDKIIPPEVLNESRLTLTGEPVDEDDSRPSHGEVKHDINVVYDHDAGTTTFILTLPNLGEGD